MTELRTYGGGSAVGRLCAAFLGPADPRLLGAGRPRLDRGGDRRLNSALHQIVLSRRRHDARTAAYIARRVSEGKSEREAIRCLKRYVARRLFRLFERSAVMT